MIVTDDCNFNCSYCRQKKSKTYMTRSTMEKAIRFFYPFFDKETNIFFYGGEPLLAFDTIKYAVSRLEEANREGGKRFNYFVTTNGSLVTGEILDFFDRRGFSIMLSFDGLCQDAGRKPGSLAATRELMRRMGSNYHPGIQLTVNSVFSPGTVSRLSESLRYIIEWGGADIEFYLAEDRYWNEASLAALEKELERVTNFLVSYYKKTGRFPVTRFRPADPSQNGKNHRVCAAGRGRMALTPGENLWGCIQFHDYLKHKEQTHEFYDYSFGKLDDFMKNHQTLYPRVLRNYSLLKQDFFFTEKQVCFLCEELENCFFCFFYAAYSTSFIGKIPSWKCRIKKILTEERKRFIKETDRIKSPV
jgi:sulfatase maturation enzyme AslB (radical SAM superfamily)